MALFPVIKTESRLVVNDQTRLDARKAFASKDNLSITTVRIDPDGAAGFLDVFGSSSEDWYFDWAYVAAGSYTVTVELGDGVTTETSTSIIEVVTEADAKLFSDDQELVRHEPDILGWVRDGRNSYADVHFRAQELIVAWLDERRFWDKDNNKLTIDDLIDLEEFKQIGTFMALRLIFEGISNAVDDIFSQKAAKYLQMEEKAKERGSIRVDLNNDGTIDDYEKIDNWSLWLDRR